MKVKKSRINITNLVRCLNGKGDVILLESQKKDHPASQKSFLAAKPEATLKAWGNKIQLIEKDEVTEFESNPFQAFSEFRQKYTDWLFGFFSYDLKNYTEDLSSGNKNIVETPDIYFISPGLLIEIEDENVNIKKGKLPEDLRRTEIQEGFSLSDLKHIDKEEYLKKIEIAQHQIKEGDYYEINLSHPIEFKFEGDSWELYQQMKESGPVPFASYIKTEQFEVCSSSPERFLSKIGRRLQSQPIKGTRSRSKDNDDVSIKDLRESEKEKAENLMIVDLVRNDLGRVAKKGGVRVKNLFEIQSFETVHQMVSTVEAELVDKISLVEILKATFPMGSMTGAPKISAMRAIEDLEDYKRGIYSGAIGYIDPGHDFDFSVVIRSAIIQKDKLVYPVGGAITSDSVPEEEWDETLIKARPITDLLNNS